MFVGNPGHHYVFHREDEMDFIKTDHNTYLCSFSITNVTFLDGDGDAIDISTHKKIVSVLIETVEHQEFHVVDKESIRHIYGLIAYKFTNIPDASTRKEFQ